MGLIRPAELAKLFTAILCGDERLLDTARERLTSSLGPIDIISPIYPWTHTKYYEKEMGTELKRVFFFFEDLFQPDMLPDIKNMTNEIERHFSEKATTGMPGRHVNIDPGYLTLSKVVLASTKDYSHRIYIGKGIYGEVTLYFRDKTYQPFPYTYPDYRSKEYIELFNMVRRMLLNIKNRKGVNYN